MVTASRVGSGSKFWLIVDGGPTESEFGDFAGDYAGTVTLTGSGVIDWSATDGSPVSIIAGWVDLVGNPALPGGMLSFAVPAGFAAGGRLAAEGLAGSGVAGGMTTVRLTAASSTRIIDIIPAGDSGESLQNSEPSLAVNPLDPNQIIASAFGPFNADGSDATSYYLSLDGGATWTDYATLSTVDKSLAWASDGSAFLTATLALRRGIFTDIASYSGTVSSGGFGAADTFEPQKTDFLDQPWIRTGPSGHVYIAYNNLNNAGTSAGQGKTASVNVSSDGGNTFTPLVIEQVAPASGQDAPAVRLAVNGNTVYAAFTRWNASIENDSNGERFASQIVVVRSDNGGADAFSALGAGTIVATPTGLFANNENTSLTLGQERSGSDMAIAVDPNNPNHVVIAYTDAPGPNGAGVVQLVVAESTDAGATWNTKFTTDPNTRSGEPALAILANGTIGFLYNSYDPASNMLSQHLLQTSDDFATASDTLLASETNATPVATFSPYLGDFFDLQAVGNTFYGIFSASNADDGTNAQFANVSFDRDFTGTPGSSSFQLTDGSGNPVAASIDPFFFTTAASNGPITWINPAGGDWSVGGNWSTGAAPVAGDDAVIGAAGTYTVTINAPEAAHSLTLNNGGATVQLNNTLAIGASLALDAGRLDLAAAGTIAGGTVSGTGMVLQGGTLSGVTYEGTLDLSASGARATVSNGISLTGAGGSGPGTVLLSGYHSALYFAGNQTLDHAAVAIGGKYGYDPLSQKAAGTLVLGPNLTVNQTGKYAELYVGGGSAITNAGTVNAAVSGGHFLIGGVGSFTNQGTINVANGDSLVVDHGVTFSNPGAITLASGAALHLKDNLATSALGSITNAGGTLSIEASLNNRGSVLATGANGLGAVAIGRGGVIAGGTITGGDMVFQSGALSGVTYQGTLDLSASGAQATIRNGITLTGAGGGGPGNVLLTGYGSYLDFVGSQTLDDVSVSLGASLEATAIPGTYSALVLAYNLRITQTGSSAVISSLSSPINPMPATIINQGTISAGVSGGTFLIDINYGHFVNQGMIAITNGDNFFLNAPFTNQGIMAVSGGAALHIQTFVYTAGLGGITNTGGTVFLEGAVNNTAAVLTTGAGSALGTVGLVGTVSRGTVTGGGMIFQGGTLSGVTYAGLLDLSATGAQLTVSNGITLTDSGGTGPGTVLLSGAYSALAFSGTQVFDNATVLIGGPSDTVRLSFTGDYDTLTLGPDLNITQTGRFAALSGPSGTIVNNGTIDAGVAGGQFTIGGGFNDKFGLTNNGLIGVSNGERLTIGESGPTTITGAGTISMGSGGSLLLFGPVAAGQKIEFVDSTGGLLLQLPDSFAGTIYGFEPGDSIDLLPPVFGRNNTVTLEPGNVLQVNETGTLINLPLDPSQNFARDVFQLSSNMLITVTALPAATPPADFNADRAADLLWRNNNGDATVWDFSPGVAGPTAIDLGVAGLTWAVQATADFTGDGKADVLWRNTATNDMVLWDSQPGADLPFAAQDIGVVGPGWAVQAAADFSGDRKADILWRNTASGDVQLWVSTPGSVGAAFTAQDLGIATADWQIEGAGDFTGDGSADILWRSASGDVGLWNSMPGGSFAWQDFGIATADWTIQAVGDFNGDGKADILWRSTSGDVGLWESTPAGGFTWQDFGVVTPDWQIQAVADFTGDGRADILWRNQNGDEDLWRSNAVPVSFGNEDLGIVPLTLAVQAAADFTGDHQADILWRDAGSGDTLLWNSIPGAASFATQDLGPVGLDWMVQAAADFTGDHQADILWRNQNGDVALWDSSSGSSTPSFTAQDLGVVGSDWTIKAAADFTGDGRADILWRNANGDVALWDSAPSGAAPSFTAQDLGIVTPDWQIQAAADFTGDGKAGILWRNTTSGDLSLWESSPGIGMPSFTAQDLGVVTPDWTFQAAADFTGDGKADILWRNQNGDVSLWDSVPGATSFTFQDLGVMANSWVVQKAADFNGDGRADILWRNTTTGDALLWTSNPGAPSFTAQDLGVLGSDWHL